MSTLNEIAMAGTREDIRSQLRIAFVVHDYNRYMGHSRYVAELATRFRNEHDVHVFCNSIEDADTANITFHKVPAWRRNGLTAMLTFLPVSTWLTRFECDIIHTQGACCLKQDVITAHMCQPSWLDAMRHFAGKPSWKKRMFHSIAGRMEQIAYRRRTAQQVIAVSHRVASDLREYYGRTDGVHVIHHGVDCETFHPRNRSAWRSEIRGQIGIDDATPVALYVGDYQKGLRVAIQAVAKIPGLHLLGVARSPTFSYQECIRSEGIEGRVKLLPGTTHIERYYAAADMLVFPTFYDPFGLVATEAMASGLPVICSSQAGASEVITDGIDGLLVAEPWNVESLAQLLGLLASDSDLRNRLGDAARQTAEKLTWDETARQTMRVYRKVVLRNK